MAASRRTPPKPLPRRPAPRTDRPLALPQRPSRYGRWRAATLAGVYVLMGLHIAHWKIAGKTLAPLELNEVMYTLELGIVTAGFLFMAVACVATLLFGRFFCGWGCHILALEDLCAWMLRKIGIRPRPIRSRLLLLVPAAAMFYMFLWPQVARVIEDRPLPTAHLRTDEQGWASFATTDFWRNLPGPGVALLTFAVCGFGIVYVLGSRSFCAYGCPYGAVFRTLDRFSPGRIVATGDCAQCGACTAACPSGVIVHEELHKFGTVVSAACLKDLECVSACPNGAVKYGLGRPPLLRSWSAWWPVRKAFDFSWLEEALLAFVFVATLLVFRGLYDAVPFLMTLGLGAIFGYIAVLAVRLAYRGDVRFGRRLLKCDGRVRASGVVFLAGAAALLTFCVHSAFIRYHEFVGYRAADRVRAASAAPPVPAGVEVSATAGHGDSIALERAIGHLDFCRRWGLFTPRKLAHQLSGLLAARGGQRAERGALAGAVADLRRAATLEPDVAAVRYNLAVMLGALGYAPAALAEYRVAAALDPADADIQNNLGFELAKQAQWAEAQACFERAVVARPDHADAHFNLARVLVERHRTPEAQEHFAAAARLDPRYAEILADMPAAGRMRP